MSELNFTHPNGNKVKLTTPDTLAANISFKLPVNDGSAGQVLQTDGNGNLSWVTPAASNVAFSMLDIYHLTAEKNLSGGVTYILDSDFSRRTHGAIGTGLTKSGQYFSFPSTGIYWINFRSETKIDSTQSSRYRVNSIWTTNDNSSYTERASNSAIPGLNSHTYSMTETAYIFDVVNTSLDKFYCSVLQEVNGKVRGSSTGVQTQLIVYKIAET
mgnify:CR=1 FL=1